LVVVPAAQPSPGFPPPSLSTLQNFRDLGGLPAAAGGRIRPRALYRSDAPDAGDGQPIAMGWPPRTVIDLRSSDEVTGGHPLASATTEVISNPLFERASLEYMIEHPDALPSDVPSLYRVLLRSAAPRLAAAVALISERPGPTLVHCTAGKDRTGVVIAVVLSAVGVPNEHVISDYRRTAANMDGVLGRMRARRAQRQRDPAVANLSAKRRDLLDAPTHAIEAALEELDDAGGAGAWLLARGLPQIALDVLHARLVS
jgi:hypothetical protein